VPGVMGNAASATEESFNDGLLEYPHYTRPASFRGWDVPDVLRSGDHGRVRRWRLAQRLARTLTYRPDLIAGRGGLSPDDRSVLAEFGLDDGPAEFGLDDGPAEFGLDDGPGRGASMAEDPSDPLP
jgi:tRNA (guanine37-N1)-methyltransferase